VFTTFEASSHRRRLQGGSCGDVSHGRTLWCWCRCAASYTPGATSVGLGRRLGMARGAQCGEAARTDQRTCVGDYSASVDDGASTEGERFPQSTTRVFARCSGRRRWRQTVGRDYLWS